MTRGPVVARGVQLRLKAKFSEKTIGPAISGQSFSFFFFFYSLKTVICAHRHLRHGVVQYLVDLRFSQFSRPCAFCPF